jgi:hypothetical protein
MTEQLGQLDAISFRKQVGDYMDFLIKGLTTFDYAAANCFGFAVTMLPPLIHAIRESM